MIYPYMYASYADLKSGDGSYKLPDVISIAVTEERNGSFDLEMQYMYNGTNADQLVCEAFIMAIPQRGQAEEPFRIYEVTTPITGVISVKAHHISYDLDGAVLQPFSETGIANILSEINTQLTSLGFDFELVNNGITFTSQFSITYPQSAASVIGSGEHSLIADFGAEISYSWDAVNQKEVVTFNASRGTVSLATVAYGYNLLTLDASTNSDAVYSAIYPYYKRTENGVTTLVTLTEQTVATGATTTRTRVLLVDLTDQFETTPSEAELRTAANDYVASIDWNAVESCTVDFVPLQNTTDFADNIGDQSISLCDIVTVSADLIGVQRSAQVVRTVYNQMTEKYDLMTVGTIPANIADTIASLESGHTVVSYGGGGGGGADPATVPTQASINASGLISFKNSSNTTLFTLQLPIYGGA